MTNHFLFALKSTVMCFVLAGCIRSFQAVPPVDWHSRSMGMQGLIESNIKMHIYDFVEIYQRNGLYYGVRRNHGLFLYSPEEAKERLLDSTVYIYAPTHHYTWDFSAGRPNGKWYYYRQYDSIPYRIESYQNGELLDRKK